ncbi:MAG: hypothetical protein GX422_08440 [Deltaproteobacteria bacterium]|nr:hypothetical protein [Deltaproteobacteria bacterium]
MRCGDELEAMGAAGAGQIPYRPFNTHCNGLAETTTHRRTACSLLGYDGADLLSPAV